MLAIRTDKPDAEIALYDDTSLMVQQTWYAHRQLAEGLLKHIQDLLITAGKQYANIGGIICYEGPGSFTGLRIGMTVGNTLAQSFDVPIAGSSGEGWQLDAISKLNTQPRMVLLPVYGAEAHITQQKK